MALVAAAARQCVATHQPATGWAVNVDVETTLDEVVEVALATASRSPLASCLVEAVWAVRLGRNFDLERERFTLRFR